MKESRYNVWVRDDGVDYVYNGMSGSLLKVPDGGREAVTRVLTDPSATDCSVTLLEQMVVARMIVNDDTDELGILAARYQRSREDTSQFGLTLVTSLGCNFDCPYCFEDKHPSIMSPAVQQAVLDVVDDQLPTIASLGVTWFGGEPLVGRSVIYDLSDAFIERCDAAGVKYDASIVTNGYLLDGPTAKELKERRVDWAQVSLDGPPDVHDRMRPLANGGPTFWRIVENLPEVVEHLEVSIRMNVDAENITRARELLDILAEQGLAGKVMVYLGQIVGVDDGAPAPSSSYGTRCLTNRQYAEAELEFTTIASEYGFSSHGVPVPSVAPCTAVRSNELVVGSAGELYKCWDSVGNERESIGSILDYRNPNARATKWLTYDPFGDDECRSCIALPVCMGGCAHHGMDLLQHENRCGTFRHVYQEQVVAYARDAMSREQPVTVGPTRPVRRVEPR